MKERDTHADSISLGARELRSSVDNETPINLYHETRVVDNLIGRLQHVGSVKQIVVRIAVLAVAALHLLEKVLQGGDGNLIGGRRARSMLVPASRSSYMEFVREVVSLHEFEADVA